MHKANLSNQTKSSVYIISGKMNFWTFRWIFLNLSKTITQKDSLILRETLTVML